MSAYEKVILAEINGVKTILSDKIKSGDKVIGYFERPVGGYWLTDCIAENLMDSGEILIFKNNNLCGVANNPFNNQKWFKILGTLNIA